MSRPAIGGGFVERCVAGAGNKVGDVCTRSWLSPKVR